MKRPIWWLWLPGLVAVGLVIWDFYDTDSARDAAEQPARHALPSGAATDTDVRAAPEIEIASSLPSLQQSDDPAFVEAAAVDQRVRGY